MINERAVVFLLGFLPIVLLIAAITIIGIKYYLDQKEKK